LTTAHNRNCVTMWDVWTNAAAYHREQALLLGAELADLAGTAEQATDSGAKARSRRLILGGHRKCHLESAAHFEHRASYASFSRT